MFFFYCYLKKIFDLNLIQYVFYFVKLVRGILEFRCSGLVGWRDFVQFMLEVIEESNNEVKILIDEEIIGQSIIFLVVGSEIIGFILVFIVYYFVYYFEI